MAGRPCAGCATSPAPRGPRASTAPPPPAPWPGWRSTRPDSTASTAATCAALIEHYDGGPAGVETLAYAIAEARDAVEDVIEPYLTQQGFIQRTPRGRVACAKAYLHIGLNPPREPKAQTGLFEDE